MGEAKKTQTVETSVTWNEPPSFEVLASPNLHYYVHLRECVCSYLPPEGVKAIDTAFVVADHAHIKQRRASGEPYIIHPIAVATLTAKMHLDLCRLHFYMMLLKTRI